MIYLDNAATSKPIKSAVDKFADMCENCYGNSSSLHDFGIEAEKVLEGVREEFARALNVSSDEIYFTSGGTESDNIAIFGGARAKMRDGKRIIACAYEHSAVYNCFEALKNEGFEPLYIGAKDGEFDLEAFENALDGDTVLVSVMSVGNETGIINPLKQIREIMNKKHSKALLHTDAVQAFGKIPCDGRDVDMLSLSSHKFGGVKGVGVLYVKKGVILRSPVYGGGHEKGLRSGTVNAPGIAAMGVACHEAVANMRENYKKVSLLRTYLSTELAATKGVTVHTFAAQSPYILSITVDGIPGETLLHHLSAQGIYVATAAACSSHKKGDPRVLTAQGYTENQVGGTLRISFCPHNTHDEAQNLLEALRQGINNLSRGVR